MAVEGYRGAIWMPVPAANVFPGYDGLVPRWLVLHKTAGGSSAQEIAQMFYAATDKRSAHYVVGQDGAIVQCVSESDGAGANCCLEAGAASYWPVSGIDLNLLTLSIEHVDPSLMNATPLTPEQQAASFALIADICRRHTIPMRPADIYGGIAGHNSLDPIDRANCPGNYPWDALWAYLAEQGGDVSIAITDPIIGRYFDVVGGNTLKRKDTGVVIGSGITNFYLKYGGPAIFRLPLTGETPVAGLPGVVYVLMEGCILVWDPDRKLDSPPTGEGAYLLHLDKGLGQDVLAGRLSPQLAAKQAALQQIVATAQKALA